MKRILGIEPISDGYKEFRIQPIPGGNLQFAQGSLETKYGQIHVSWKFSQEEFFLNFSVPNNTYCTVCLPDGTCDKVSSGQFEYKVEKLKIADEYRNDMK